jgi:hypothetical protein
MHACCLHPAGSALLVALCQRHGSEAHRNNSTQHPQPDIAAAVEAARAASGMGGNGVLVLSHVLGKGGWGTVHQGSWKGLDVAVKTMIFTSQISSPSSGKQRSLPYHRAVTEAAVCTTVLHRNVVATYRYDIKQLRPQQEPGQYLEVDVGEGGADVPGMEVADFKLYLIQELCAMSVAVAVDEKVGCC